VVDLAGRDGADGAKDLGAVSDGKVVAADLMPASPDLSTPAAVDLAGKPAVDLAVPAVADLAIAPPADLASADLNFGSYPAGPYGGAVGAVVPNFSFKGYFNPKKVMGLASEAPFGDVTLDMVRTSGAKMALIELAGFW
jgi:hypothetical protein